MLGHGFAYAVDRDNVGHLVVFLGQAERQSIACGLPIDRCRYWTEVWSQGDTSAARDELVTCPACRFLLGSRADEP